MAKVVIGIHGLANKPPEETLARWWKTSILEGLENIDVGDADFEFRMVYWADLLYRHPLHEEEHFHFDKLYNNEPYRAAEPDGLQEYKDGWLDSIRATAFDWGGSTIDVLRQKFKLKGVSTWLLGKLLRDLAFYYDEERTIPSHDDGTGNARAVLDATLEKAIVAETGNEIMVIAHSMGTIISYNTLRNIGRSHPDCKVSDFITIGSPLGLPYVKSKIVEERGYDPRVRTPSCVTTRWKNYADRKDPVALDVHLRDDFRANGSGVRVEDDMIRNDFHRRSEPPKRNAHKSYGYLRTPELATQVRDFLAE
ncbi:MAG: hypothetical protein O7J95_05440 [Planctomycetota bacterium]|nr:hypothetical protein [Planctomycetota bacterium]